MYESGAETKKKILEAAIQLFMEKGYNGTTYADICAAADVNQGSIYYHFKKKAEVYRHANQWVNAINSYAAQRLCPPGSPAYFPFLLDIYIYWYRYFSEAGFRLIMSENVPASALDDGNDPNRNLTLFWGRCSAFIGDFEHFASVHALDFLICSNIDSVMSEYYKDKTDDNSFIDTAEYQLRSFAAIFHMHRDVCEATLRQLREVFDESAIRQLPALLEEAQQNT